MLLNYMNHVVLEYTEGNLKGRRYRTCTPKSLEDYEKNLRGIKVVGFNPSSKELSALFFKESEKTSENRI